MEGDGVDGPAMGLEGVPGGTVAGEPGCWVMAFAAAEGE